MTRRRWPTRCVGAGSADLDAGLRTVLVDDAVEAAALAVRRLERATTHELDDAARSALMEQLLVAFVAPAGVPSSMSSAMPGTVPAPPPARPPRTRLARKEIEHEGYPPTPP